MRGDGVNEGYHIHELSIEKVVTHRISDVLVLHRPKCDCGFVGLDWSTAKLAEQEAGEHLIDCGMPWCDTCSGVAILSSFYGLLHWSVDFPMGVPSHLDESDHSVSIVKWNRGDSSESG